MTSPDAAGPDRRSDRALASSSGDELTFECSRDLGHLYRLRAELASVRVERYYRDRPPAERVAERLAQAGAAVELTSAAVRGSVRLDRRPPVAEWREVRP